MFQSCLLFRTHFTRFENKLQNLCIHQKASICVESSCQLLLSFLSSADHIQSQFIQGSTQRYVEFSLKIRRRTLYFRNHSVKIYHLNFWLDFFTFFGGFFLGGGGWSFYNRNLFKKRYVLVLEFPFFTFVNVVICASFYSI